MSISYYLGIVMMIFGIVLFSGSAAYYELAQSHITGYIVGSSPDDFDRPVLYPVFEDGWNTIYGLSLLVISFPFMIYGGMIYYDEKGKMKGAKS